MTAFPFSILVAMYSGVRRAIPVPRILADSSMQRLIALEYIILLILDYINCYNAIIIIMLLVLL